MGSPSIPFCQLSFHNALLCSPLISEFSNPDVYSSFITSIIFLTYFSFCWNVNKVSSALGPSSSGMTSLSVTLLFIGVIPIFSYIYMKFNLNPFLLPILSEVGRG